MDGEIAFGRWAEHIKRWVAHAKADPRVLILRYEDMKRDLRRCVHQINEHCEFGLPADAVDALLPRFSFEAMRANLRKFSPRSVQMIEKGDGFAFIRKGAVGDHKALFSEDQLADFEAMSRVELSEGGLTELLANAAQ